MEHPLVGRVGRADVARLEPFQMYQSPPTEVQILRFRQSDAHSLIRSFVRSLVRSLRKSPFRETYKTVTKKKRRKEERRLGWNRKGEGKRM